MQILTVAMVLDYTVSMLNFFSKLGDELEPTIKTVEDTSPSIKRVIESKNGVVKSFDELYAEFGAIKKQLADVNFDLLDNNIKIHVMIDKLFNIRKHAKRFRHKDSKLFKEVNNEIDSFVIKLKKLMENVKNDIKQKQVYLQSIQHEISKLSDGSVSDIDIPLIRNTCTEAGIKCPNINEHLSPTEIKEKLKKVQNMLLVKMQFRNMLRVKIHTLLKHIEEKNRQIIKHDTRDTLSMRNVIGISIAVCAIVTLCIVLLIAVRNKNRVNAEVRLLNWV